MSVLHFEAVDFSGTIFDTQDISTIRGSSRAIEDIVQAFAGHIERNGGSILRAGGAQLTAQTELSPKDLVEELPEDLVPVYPHLRFISGRGETEMDAIAAARHQQMREVSVLNWGAPATRPCALDRKRPATVQQATGKGTIWLSASVAARRAYGREARSGLYRHLGARAPSALPASFEELIGGAPEGVSEVALSKLVVLHADGAGFGAALAEVGSKRFSEELARLQADLVQHLFEWLAGLEARGRTKAGAPRIETLLFGGEDMDFVLPSWLALAFLAQFFEATKDWKIGEVPLSHRVSGIIAHYKTPIRQMRGLAHQGVDLLRGCAGTNIYSLDVFESVAPPESLSVHRRRVFGDMCEDQHFAKQLGQLGQDVTRLTALISGEDEALSRSQLYRLLSPHTDFADPATSEAVAKAYADYALRMGRPTPEGDVLGALPFAAEPAALRLASVASLWDYVGGGQ